MDERILVETCLPVVQMRFDAGLASSLTIQQAMQLLYEAAKMCIRDRATGW